MAPVPLSLGYYARRNSNTEDAAASDTFQEHPRFSSPQRIRLFFARPVIGFGLRENLYSRARTYSVMCSSHFNCMLLLIVAGWVVVVAWPLDRNGRCRASAS